MNIVQATRAYERWLSQYAPLIPSELRSKHAEWPMVCFRFCGPHFIAGSKCGRRFAPSLPARPEFLQLAIFTSKTSEHGAILRGAWFGASTILMGRPVSYINDLVPQLMLATNSLPPN